MALHLLRFDDRSSLRKAEMPRTTEQPDGEIEWQLIAPDLDAVHRWLVEHHTIQGLVVERRPPLQIHDEYFDTNDWRIQRAGFSLRVRSADGAIEAALKELSPPKQGVANRRELVEPLADATADAVVHSPGSVGTRVHAVAGRHALRPLFSVRTLRQRFAVRRRHGGEDLGEIALDDTVISRPDGEPQTNLTRIEVETMTSERESLRGLVKTLFASARQRTRPGRPAGEARNVPTLAPHDGGPSRNAAAEEPARC